MEEISKAFLGAFIQSSSVFGSNCTVNPDNPDELNNSACLDSHGRPKVFEAGNGPTTGRCLESGQCEIRAWCDVEEENEAIT